MKSELTLQKQIGRICLLLILVFHTSSSQIPRVESFDPRSARVGDIIHISGSNFSGVGTGNVVYFGPARASAVLPDTVQPDRGFRVVVPAGATHDKITVTVSGLTGYSRLLFLPRFVGSGGMSFAPPLYVGPSRSVTFLDANGDNKLDLAGVGWSQPDSQYKFSMYQNRGIGISFDAPVDVPVSNAATNVYDIGRGDFDGDGRLDIVITTQDFGGVGFDSAVVIQNTGTGNGFRLAARLYEGNEVSGVAVADMDLDGKPDIIIPDRNDRRNGFIRIFRNTTPAQGSISFEALTPMPTVRCPWNIAVADFNNDGFPDIAYPMSIDGLIVPTPDSIAILQNHAGSSYGPPTYYKMTRRFQSQVEVLDFDGDTRNDLVFVCDNGDAVSFLRNTGSGTVDIGFFLQDSIKLGINVRRHSVADWNGDGKPDVVIPATGAGIVIVLKNKSTRSGDFSVDTLHFIAQSNQLFSLGGDLNNDGKPDIVVAGGDRSTAGMSYLMNTTPAAPDEPLLQFPGNNSVNVQLPVRFVWNSSARATAYHLQVALTQDFLLLAVNDSSLADTTFQPNALAYNTTYYWRVAGRTANGDGFYSAQRSFSTASTALLSGGISFPANPASDTDYRLVSIPGISRFTVGNILTGVQTTDWRIFRENGANPPNDLTELSAAESLKIGEGYLVVRKGAFSFSRTVTMPSLRANGTYSFPVEKKWILIGNPFDKTVAWQSVIVSSGLTPRTLYTYQGSIQTDSLLRPFTGYLFENVTGLNMNAVDTLRFPFPFPSVPVPPILSIPFSWKLQLVLESEGKLDMENHIGISSHARAGRDSLEEHKPPLFLNKGTISFSRPQWDEANSLFSSDFRPAIDEGQAWEFEVRNDRLSRAKIRIVGVEQVPTENEIVLVNRQNSVPMNVRLNPEYEYQTVSSKMTFKLLVGKKSFVANELQKEVPTEFRLDQNYPNPFNPTTSLGFAVPREADVRLEIISVLGERVAVLGEGRYQPGTYTVVWNTSETLKPGNASGVYFCRFVVDGKPFALRKMLLLK